MSKLNVKVLASNSRHIGSSATFLRSPAVDQERMMRPVVVDDFSLVGVSVLSSFSASTLLVGSWLTGRASA